MTKGSDDARMQPLYFLITTAGTDTNSICYETHQKAKDILEGRKIDPTFYPVIYGADETQRSGRKPILLLESQSVLIKSKLPVNLQNRIPVRRIPLDS